MRGRTTFIEERHMVSEQEYFEDVLAAAQVLAEHPKDAAWREFYRLVTMELDDQASPLWNVFASHFSEHPYGGAAHACTVLGIAFKEQAGDKFGQLTKSGAIAERLALFSALLRKGHGEITMIMRSRRNSFTCARRFLVPQILLSHYFKGRGESARLADMGTGLGILPRQLNCRRLYDSFVGDLRWPGGAPTYTPIQMERRFGIDRPPFPDLEWVRACYGESEHYQKMFDELRWAQSLPEVADASVAFTELDMQKLDHLSEFLTRNRVNAVVFSYVLFELRADGQQAIIDTVLESMPSPSMVIVMDPRPELMYRGCAVTLYLDGDNNPLDFAVVSDGHFIGDVLPQRDYAQFADRYLLPGPR